MDYSVDAVAADYEQIELALDVEYQVNDAWLTSLSYVWTEISFDNGDDREAEDKLVVGAEYGFEAYAIYLEYEFAEENNAAIMGVAYSF